MTALATNGHAPVDFEQLANEMDEHDEEVRDGLREVAVSLQMLIRDEARKRVKLEGLLEDSKQRERRMQKALNDLTGESSTPAKKTAAAKDSHDWQPSDERVDQVRGAILKYVDAGHEKFTQTELGRYMKEDLHEGMGSETVAKCMLILRDREFIRMAAKTRGGGTLWAVMRGAHGA